MNPFFRIAPVVLVTFCVIWTGPGCRLTTQTAGKIISDTLAMGDDEKLSLEQTNGLIQIQGGAEGELSVEADIEVKVLPGVVAGLYDAYEILDKVGVEIVDTDEGVSIRTLDQNVTTGLGVTIVTNYTITVPEDVSIDLVSANGDVSVTDVHGVLAMGLDNGEMTVENGDNTVSAQVDNGRIVITNTPGSVEARVSNGDVSYSREDMLVLTDSLDAEVDNGRIDVALPKVSGFDVVASVDNGDIEPGCFGFEVGSLSETGAQLNADNLGGGANIGLHVDNGSIHFICN